MGAYDSTYSVYTNPSSWSNLGTPTFNATLRLGDNSAGGSGLAELLLNGASGQLAWGADGGGHLDSDVNYPSPDYVTFDLEVPQSTSPTQSPASLTVGNASAVQYSGAASYASVTNALVEAVVTTGGMPTACVSVTVSNVSIIYYDVNSNATTNPNAGTSPAASQGTGCGGGVNTQALLATPAPPPGFVPVRVSISGSVRFVSTDSFYKNYGSNLSATALQLKIYIWTK